MSKNINENKDKFVSLFLEIVPNFEHKEKGRNLDNKM